VVSVAHTRREHKYITVWRTDDCGYAWPLSWAGRYSDNAIQSGLDYYHNGDDNIAIKCEVLDAICSTPEPGTIDNDAGPVVMNTESNWSKIVDSIDFPTKNVPYPQFKGARKKMMLKKNHEINI
jgi:hypothetical protein